MKKVILGYDHKAIELGKNVQKILNQLGYEVVNLGTKDESETLLLQDLVPNFVKHYKDVDFGVISCGSGVGVEIGVNKFRGIRGSLIHSPEQAKLARQYDDANVLCLAAWDDLELEKIIKIWVETDYDGSENRRKMLDIFDTWGQ
jgi:ribose 5-phosphate isomerase B